MNKIFFLLVLTIFSSGGFSMSIMDVGKACTFSQMELEVTYEGKPASGAKVWRRVKWQKEKIDEFTSDENGRVVLPKILQRSVSQLFPLEFVVSQALIVTYQENEYKIWINSKRNPDENSELDGNSIKLRCELTKDPELVTDYKYEILTSCEIL